MGDELKETAGEVVGQLIKVAADEPEMKRAGQEFAGALLTVAKAVNVALLPLAAINYGCDKARAYFEKQFEADIAEHTASIPPDVVVMPKASIAGPALQGLAFTHDEPDLKNLYLKLLATSMNGQRVADAHPAFVEIIKQLTAQEARLLAGVLIIVQPMPIAEIRVSRKGENSWVIFHKHLIDLKDSRSSEPISGVDVAAMVTNWIRLGLVDVDYTKSIAHPGSYDWVEKSPVYQMLRDAPDFVNITVTGGFIERTAFGEKFASAVGLSDIASAIFGRQQTFFCSN